MKVALVSTSAVATPPKAYGGTELIVAELAKGLTQLGHDVTVFATGDSTTKGKLKYHFERPEWPPHELAEIRHAGFAWKHITAEDPPFDVVHVHQLHSLPFAANYSIPTFLTLHHKRVDRLVEFYKDYPNVHYVGISHRQAELVPEMDVRHVIWHGLDPALYPAGEGDGGYCAFLGRFAPEKGPDIAIDAARLAGVRIELGGEAHVVNQDYFEAEVKPRLAVNDGSVNWRGELAHAPKLELLQHAQALLFPIDWEEPFGLVMIEAMLVGTPVIAFPRGSAPEVIEEGVTGFIVHSTEEMAARLKELESFDRHRCRARAQAQWSTMRMAREYLGLYDWAIKQAGRSTHRLHVGANGFGATVHLANGARASRSRSIIVANRIVPGIADGEAQG